MQQEVRVLYSFLHCVRRNAVGLLPELAPFRIHAFVEGHANRVHLVDGTIEVRLEVTMRTERLLNVTCASILGMQLYGFEVVDVVYDTRLVHLESEC